MNKNHNFNKKINNLNFQKIIKGQNKKKMNSSKDFNGNMSTSSTILVNLAMRLRILRQMTNLSISDYCAKYELDEVQYTSYENGENIIPNNESSQLISKMFFNNEIFCRAEWLEGYEKIAPVYITPNSLNMNEVKAEDFSSYGRMINIAYSYKLLNENNIIAVICDSVMGKFLKKGTIVVGEKYDLKNQESLKSIENVLCIIETKNNKEMIRYVTFNNGYFFCNSVDPIRQNIFDLDDISHIAKVNFTINRDLLNEEKEEELMN